MEAKATPNPAVVGQQVALHMAATDIDGDALTYEWTLPDGSKLTGADASTSFTSAGSKVVQYKVSDGKAAPVGGSVTVTVNSPSSSTSTSSSGTSSSSTTSSSQSSTTTSSESGGGNGGGGDSGGSGGGAGDGGGGGYNPPAETSNSQSTTQSSSSSSAQTSSSTTSTSSSTTSTTAAVQGVGEVGGGAPPSDVDAGDAPPSEDGAAFSVQGQGQAADVQGAGPWWGQRVNVPGGTAGAWIVGLLLVAGIALATVALLRRPKAVPRPTWDHDVDG